MSEGSTAVDASLGERIADWYAELTWRRAATVLHPDETTWVLLDAGWPRSYAHNGLLLRSDPGPEVVLALGDEHLGGAGLEHRYVFGFCALTDATREALTGAGFSIDAEVVMARPIAAGRLAAPDGVVVEDVPLEHPDVVALQERLWVEEWLPAAQPQTVRELVDRRSSYSRSGPMHCLLVRDPGTGQAVATTDLCIAGWGAEVDGVATAAAYRGRRYGDAMLARAVELSAAAGCSWTVLTAMVEDWPRDWYARRGFVTTGPAWAAARHPAGGT